MTSRRPKALDREPVEPFDVRGARVAALDALARRDHSSEDLRRKLLQKGYDATVVVPLLDALSVDRLLDDRRYTENFVAYHAARGQGPMRVRLELRRHGLHGPLVEDYLAHYPEWIAQLRNARQKKFGAELPTIYADKRRQSRFLGYRGFTGVQIRTALGFDVDTDLDLEPEET